VILEIKVQMEIKVGWEQPVMLGMKVMMDLMEELEIVVIAANLEFMETQVQMEMRGQYLKTVQLVLSVIWVLPAQQDYLVKVDQVECLAKQVVLELQQVRVQPELLVPLVSLEMEELKEKLGLLVFRDILDGLDIQVYWVKRVQMEMRVQWVIPVLD
jgi:hypothetical protein